MSQNRDGWGILVKILDCLPKQFGIGWVKFVKICRLCRSKLTDHLILAGPAKSSIVWVGPTAFCSFERGIFWCIDRMIPLLSHGRFQRLSGRHSSIIFRNFLCQFNHKELLLSLKSSSQFVYLIHWREVSIWIVPDSPGTWLMSPRPYSGSQA